MEQTQVRTYLGIAQAQISGGLLDKSVLKSLLQIFEDLGNSKNDRLRAASLLSRIPCMQE